MAEKGKPAPGLLTQQLDSPSRVDDVTDRLVTAIAVGEYLPGARLPVERELAQSLGVGRMTVRAALARLVERGLLETKRGRGGGSYVLQQWPESSTEAVGRTLSLRFDEMRDRCEAIARLHGAVCRAAADFRSQDDIATLSKRLDDYRMAESGRPAQLADARLHLAIMDAAHNATLKQVLLELESANSIGTSTHPWGEPATMREMELRALGEHTALIEAITDGRGDAADAIARSHLSIDLEHIAVAMRRAGVRTA
jgi:GntR family transcriptional repressor for pyruvate dehydrogenase complex